MFTFSNKLLVHLLFCFTCYLWRLKSTKCQREHTVHSRHFCRLYTYY